ncbi:aminoglycoside 6'-N-acetyltransferase [Paenibacillus taihuensis]|uniref:Aminoglycoside 6'-N-acetyltransferase n=1 Tax=Paenibacillus taihuensis TaxID=1156355 RepID=A0A3D9SF70_9BACL|nr:GNAT family N-acetyltransferase [Paenibacillus taihuensis]REE94539.1 aminoglycoside 6'-N-acetyltransferase [Paenibacillus taihuensis]
MIFNIEVNLRKMTTDDYSCMLGWRNDPEVMRFYGNPNDIHTMEKVIQKYQARVDGADRKIPCIIEYLGNPVGYLQYYELDSEQKQEYEQDAQLNMIGMDIFMGSSEHRNKGIATQAIQLLQSYLREKSIAGRIILKTAIDNPTAARCYEKCGFVKIKALSEKLILMEYSFN